MSKALYSVINPVVKLVLRSPLHGLMSRNTLILEFKGRKSGKTYTTPVSYHATDSQVNCFTAKDYKWWRNLVDADEVGLMLQGRKVTGKPSVLADGSSHVKAALHDLLLAVPRDAPHAGVALDADGSPSPSDLEEASKRLVLISIAIQD